MGQTQRTWNRTSSCGTQTVGVVTLRIGLQADNARIAQYSTLLKA